MAGSYKHCTNDDGSFIGEEFSEVIENLGDAHEACEMMHWMIEFLSLGDRTRIEMAEKAYYAFRRRSDG